MTERQPAYASMPSSRMGTHACAATTTRDSSSSSKPPAPSSDFARRNDSVSERSVPASDSERVATIGSDVRTVRHAASVTMNRSGFRKRNIFGRSLQLARTARVGFDRLSDGRRCRSFARIPLKRHRSSVSG